MVSRERGLGSDYCHAQHGVDRTSVDVTFSNVLSGSSRKAGIQTKSILFQFLKPSGLVFLPFGNPPIHCLCRLQFVIRMQRDLVYTGDTYCTLLRLGEFHRNAKLQEVSQRTSEIS